MMSNIHKYISTHRDEYIGCVPKEMKYNSPPDHNNQVS